ncbi:MAG: hypothetical protein H7039_04610 [Bryobacteraceae bacterium]|nr:hypothetical protein [Bryobacteraceae bacterium]
MRLLVPIATVFSAISLFAGQATPEPKPATTTSQQTTGTDLSQSEALTTAPRSTTERPNMSGAGLDKTLTGVLMDASCRAIAVRNSSAELTTVSPSHSRQDGMTGASAQSTQGETGRTRTETEQRSRLTSPRTAAGTDNKPMPRLTETGRASSGPANASATGTTGAAVAPPSATVSGTADAPMSRLTESGRRSAISGPSHASALGTTGAAADMTPSQVRTPSQAGTPPQSGNLQSMDTVQGPGASSGTGDRARRSARDVAAAESVSGDAETVREKYQACQVTASTTSFALHAEGALYVLDRASNQMVQEQMRNEAFRASMSDKKDASRWMTVTVQGTPTSENVLTIRSVRK